MIQRIETDKERVKVTDCKSERTHTKKTKNQTNSNFLQIKLTYTQINRNIFTCDCVHTFCEKGETVKTIVKSYSI